jgi:hypothetical protein
MRKNIYIAVLLVTAQMAFSQVTIGSAASPSPNSMFSVVNKEDNAAQSKGMMIPTVNNETEFHYTTPASPLAFNKDPSMQGMIMYRKDIQRVVVYDGEQWKPTFYESAEELPAPA